MGTPLYETENPNFYIKVWCVAVTTRSLCIYPYLCRGKESKRTPYKHNVSCAFVN